MTSLRNFALIVFALIVVADAARHDAATNSARAPHSQSSPASSAKIWEPPTAEFGESIPNATVPKKMVSKITVSGSPVVLEKTSLAEIAARFGATAGHRGDAGDSVQWLCFRGTDPGGDWVLWLESYEIDGGTVGGFQWQRVGSATVFDGRCRMLAGKSVELPDRLRLGLTKEEVKTILGEPTVWRGDTAVYVHGHTESIRGERFTSQNVVEFLFRDGKTQAIRASKTTTD